MPGSALADVIRELTSTAREMEAEAQGTSDALLCRRLMHYRGRLLGLIDAANAGVIERGRAPSD